MSIQPVKIIPDVGMKKPIFIIIFCCQLRHQQPLGNHSDALIYNIRISPKIYERETKNVKAITIMILHYTPF